ncbi:hypothetical protein [Duganella vulcania]|uniref:Uncharacterized protein n=1 Tax=Duganella vulcania TaxID=2692166 RepID=A0A845GW11_9BURK|nr:hypothetical protein [Duganella vulcania]MYM98653.1 hypothetical protein [Duganella vulcania]
MTSDTTTTTGLDTLLSIGIITAGQRRRALADPGASEVAAMESMSGQLVWMIQRDIVTPDDMAHACTRIETSYSEEEGARHLEIISETLAKYLSVREQINRDKLGALVSAALITQSELDRILPQLPQELLLESPGEALVWLTHNGHISGRRLKTFRRDGAGGDVRRTAILQEVERLDREYHDAKTAYLRALLPGPVWMWIAVPMLAFSVYIWHTVTPSAAPACTDPDISRTLDGLMLRASIDQRISSMRPSADATLPRVSGIKEVGYASEPRIRGCKATLTIDKTETPYAFTIEPSAPGKQDFAVVGASPAIVEARFGHLTTDGKFINTAEPIGRAAAERAFRAGVEQLMSSALPAGRRLTPEPPMSGIPKLATSSPERSREIAEVEPLAPCREIAAGTAYSCRLLVERNDPLLAAIGRDGSTTLEGDFVFERDGATGPWHMAKGFDEAFVNAVAASRIQSLTR